MHSYKPTIYLDDLLNIIKPNEELIVFDINDMCIYKGKIFELKNKKEYINHYVRKIEPFYANEIEYLFIYII